MKSKILIFLGVVIAVTLMVVALRTWEQAPHVAVDSDRPEKVIYAGRASAVAMGTLAQTIVILMVLGNIYRRRTSDIVLRVLAVTLFVVSLVGAIALTLAARS